MNRAVRALPVVLFGAATISLFCQVDADTKLILDNKGKQFEAVKKPKDGKQQNNTKLNKKKGSSCSLKKDGKKRSTVDTSCPNGFNVGVGLMQSWSVARNYADKADFVLSGKRYSGDLMGDFAKYKRVKLDPLIHIGYSLGVRNGIWGDLSGEAVFGKTVDGVAEGTDEKGIQFYEKAKSGGVRYSLKGRVGYHLESFGTIYGIAGISFADIKFCIISEAGVRNRLKRAILFIGVGSQIKVAANIFACSEYEYFGRKSTSWSVASKPGVYNKEVTFLSRRYRTSLHGNSLVVSLVYYPFM